MHKPIIILLLLLANQAIQAKQAIFDKHFESKMIHQVEDDLGKHKLTKTNIDNVLAKAHYDQSVIDKINKPYEDMPWWRYEKRLVSNQKIAKGVKYWHQHQLAIENASKKYGVDSSILVAIVGIESNYGNYQASHSTLDSLTTLGLTKNRRQKFFQSELESLLQLATITKTPVEEIKGSYAGALGIPQFMPSNYLKFGQDADNDGKVDLFKSHADAIASAAKYLQHFGWNNEQAPLFQEVIAKNPKTVQGRNFLEKWDTKLSPIDLAKMGVKPKSGKMSQDGSYLVVVKPNSKPLSKQIYLTSHNWKVITKYNRSPRYALAVAKLANTIEKSYYDKTKKRS